MVSFKEAADKIEYKRNAELATTEVSRHRASWDKLVTHLEDETYQTQPKVYKL
jgi:plasmid replication initiation protein